MPDRAAADDSWMGQIDRVIADIFLTMLRKTCCSGSKMPPAENDISATILLSGPIDAQCILDLPTKTAQKLTSALLHSDIDWGDEILEDAAGELCNMIAGGWKRGMQAPGFGSDLSTPQISRGPHQDLLETARVKLCKTYAFDNFPFTVSLAIL